MTAEIEQLYKELWDFVLFRVPEVSEHPEINDDNNLGRNYILGEVGTYIRNYIGKTKIPVWTPGIAGMRGSLFYVWAGLAVDTVRYWLISENNDPDNVNLHDVSEVKLGDTTVRRGGQLDSTPTNQTLGQHMPNLDNLVYNYQHSLDQFRLMRWA